MKKFCIMMCITLMSVASAVAKEEFMFEVTTTADGQVFAIPVSGGNGEKDYHWNINWGDGVDSFGYNRYRHYNTRRYQAHLRKCGYPHHYHYARRRQ